jgi:hypothetical protein
MSPLTAQAAAEHLAQHPPAGREEAEQQAAKLAPKAANPAAAVDARWKWDMLRPVVLEDVDRPST